jgi:membrane protein DedA with SNARE-associated domain
MQQPMLTPTLVLATIVYLVVLVPALLIAPFAGFLLEEHTTDLLAYLLAVTWFSFPGTIVVALLGAWLAHMRSMHRTMSVLLLLPILQAGCIVALGLLHFAR